MQTIIRTAFYGYVWTTVVFLSGSAVYLQNRFGGGRLRWNVRLDPDTSVTRMKKKDDGDDSENESLMRTSSSNTRSGNGPNTLRILSQNTWLSFFAGGPSREERVRILLKGIEESDADVVALQEVFILGCGPIVFMADFWTIHRYMVDHLGYNYFSDPFDTLPYTFGQNSGLCIYSRVPFAKDDSARVHHQSFNIRWRRVFSMKGFQFARFEIPTISGDSTKSISEGMKPQRLLLFNTHLEHKLNDLKTGQFKEICSNIAAELGKKSAMAKTDSEGEWRLCLGDLNISSPSGLQPPTEERTNNSEHLYRPLCEEMGKVGLKHDLYADVFRTYRVMASHKETHARLDHVFANQAALDSLSDTQLLDFSTESTPGSDHFALQTDFKLG